MFKPKELKFKKLKWFFGYDAFAWYPTAWMKNFNDAGLKRHETVHLNKHQYPFYKYGWHFGILVYRILYHLILPVGWNPIRWWAEIEAFNKGNRLSLKKSKKIVKKKYLLWFHK